MPEAAKSIEGLKILAATINLDSIKEQNPTLESPVLKVLEDLQNDALITRDPGAGKKDPITGTQTDDTMIPPSGRGVLTGGAGADNFAFIEADKFGKRGADRITDFKPAEGDKIVLSDAVFTGLSEIKFKSVRSKAGLKKALRSDATIIYDQSTGSIYFDGNGDLAGQGSGGLFAVLNGRPKLTAADFSLLQTSTLQV